MSFNEITLLAIALAIAAFFVIGLGHLLWFELKGEFTRRRELRELGKERHKRRQAVTHI